MSCFVHLPVVCIFLNFFYLDDNLWNWSEFVSGHAPKLFNASDQSDCCITLTFGRKRNLKCIWWADSWHIGHVVVVCKNFRIIQTSDELFIAVLWKVPWDWHQKTRCLLLVVATLNSRHLTWGWSGCIWQIVWNLSCDWDQTCFILGIKNLDIFTYMNKSALDMIYNFDLNLDKGYLDYILLRIFLGGINQDSLKHELRTRLSKTVKGLRPGCSKHWQKRQPEHVGMRKNLYGALERRIIFFSKWVVLCLNVENRQKKQQEMWLLWSLFRVRWFGTCEVRSNAGLSFDARIEIAAKASQHPAPGNMCDRPHCWCSWSDA